MFVYMCDIWTSTNGFVGRKPSVSPGTKRRDHIKYIYEWF